MSENNTYSIENLTYSEKLIIQKAVMKAIIELKFDIERSCDPGIEEILRRDLDMHIALREKV